MKPPKFLICVRRVEKTSTTHASSNSFYRQNVISIIDSLATHLILCRFLPEQPPLLSQYIVQSCPGEEPFVSCSSSTHRPLPQLEKQHDVVTEPLLIQNAHHGLANEYHHLSSSYSIGYVSKNSPFHSFIHLIFALSPTCYIRTTSLLLS